jgi:hypothetical protein
MFGSNSIYGGGSTFGTMNLDELQRNYQLQMERLNGMKQQQQASLPILEEINRTFNSMTVDEQTMLMDSHEYQLAKNTYEASFMGYLSSKFSQEYVATPEGKMAAENLLNTIKSAKDKIAYESKVKKEKIDKMLELLDNDPEMRARYDKLVNGGVTSASVTQSTVPVSTQSVPQASSTPSVNSSTK